MGAYQARILSWLVLIFHSNISAQASNIAFAIAERLAGSHFCSISNAVLRHVSAIARSSSFMFPAELCSRNVPTRLLTGNNFRLARHPPGMWASITEQATRGRLPEIYIGRRNSRVSSFVLG